MLFAATIAITTTSTAVQAKSSNSQQHDKNLAKTLGQEIRNKVFAEICSHNPAVQEHNKHCPPPVSSGGNGGNMGAGGGSTSGNQGA